MSLSRQQFTLLGIFALFLGPVLLVMLMRSSWWQYQPAGMKNHGHLVQPPVQLALDNARDIDGKWLILHVLDDPCEQRCLEDVTALRQIHRAAGRHAEHLSIALLGEKAADQALGSRLNAIYPEFIFITDDERTALKALAAIQRGSGAESSASAGFKTYVVDPMLNVVLAYGEGSSPNDMHKDLKRLLKWSDQER